MSTRLSHDLTYDATPEQVSAMLDDPAFREEVCRRQGATRQDVAIDGDTVRIEFARRTEGLPSYATKIVGDEVTIVQSETWSSTTAATVALVIPGKPGEISGTLAIEETASGAVERVELDITVKVPLVGGKIEGLLKGMLRDALKKEHQVGQEWLAR